MWLGNLGSLRWQDGVDFGVLILAFYVLIRWAMVARALRLALSVVGFYVASLIARSWNLVITAWVLEAAAVITVVLLVVVFQAEIRRPLMRLDSRFRSLTQRRHSLTEAYREIAEAAFSLAANRTGALIVLVRSNSVADITDGGVELGATISPDLVEAVFQKSSPLHDGALLVEGDRIRKAGVVLPLTQRAGLPRSWGMRHRAAMGLAERSDALVVAVSEQSGDVHLVVGRGARRVPDAPSLLRMLEDLHSHPARGFSGRLRRALLGNWKPRLAALGLALLFWAAISLLALTSVRTFSVPVEFSDVPDGLEVVGQSTTRIQLQVRGSEWLLDSIDLDKVVAHLDLQGVREGWQNRELQADFLDLPPGIVVERIYPERVSVHLTRRTS